MKLEYRNHLTAAAVALSCAALAACADDETGAPTERAQKVSSAYEWSGYYGSDSEAGNTVAFACGDSGGQCVRGANEGGNYYCSCWGTTASYGGAGGYALVNANGSTEPSYVASLTGGGGGSATPTLGQVIVQTKTAIDFSFDLLKLRIDPCNVLKDIQAAEHPYFFYGVYAGAGFASSGFSAGTDAVFDLWNRQAAAFNWGKRTVDVGSAGGIKAGVYGGYAFGNKAGVLDAWSGQFGGASISASIPGTKISADAAFFQSPDGSVNGVSGGVTAGIGAGLPVSGAIENGYWTPYDTGTAFILQQAETRGAAGTLDWIANYDVNAWLEHGQAQPRPGGPIGTYDYIKFHSPTDMAVAILRNNPAALTTAAEALILGLLKDNGVTMWSYLNQNCPGAIPTQENCPYSDVSDAERWCSNGIRACDHGYACQ
jgi:hypothetical protein